jgi:23S rRNA (guanosine2251-2'-O)-methyltransferase
MQKSKKILSSHEKNQKTHIIYGKHAVYAALENPKRTKLKIFATKKHLSDLENFSKEIKLEIVDRYFFDDLFRNDNSHQEIALEVLPLEQPSLKNIQLHANQKSLIIILDQVNDPHNIGAVLRTAAAFGASAVLNTTDNSPNETPAMAKSACGAMDLVPYIKITNVSNTLEELKKNGYWCYALDGTADLELPTSFSDKAVIILGSEEKGIRRLVLKNCDEIYKINISSKMESLNISNAAAIAMYRFFN